MSRPLARRRPPGETRGACRSATCALAVVLAVAAHLAAGGSMANTGFWLLSSIGLVGFSTWFACEFGLRARGPSATVALVGAGQGGLELVLWSGGHGVPDPLLAAWLHACVGLLLVGLTLGMDRVRAEIDAAADRSWPIHLWAQAPVPAPRCSALRGARYDVDREDTDWWPAQRPVRGPPHAR